MNNVICFHKCILYGGIFGWRCTYYHESIIDLEDISNIKCFLHVTKTYQRRFSLRLCWNWVVLVTLQHRGPPIKYNTFYESWHLKKIHAIYTIFTFFSIIMCIDVLVYSSVNLTYNIKNICRCFKWINRILPTIKKHLQFLLGNTLRKTKKF